MKLDRELIDEYLLEFGDQPVEGGKIREDMHLIDDLGLDSLGAVSLVMELEEKFGIFLDADEMGNLVTVKDLYSFVERAWEAKACAES